MPASNGPCPVASAKNLLRCGVTADNLREDSYNGGCQNLRRAPAGVQSAGESVRLRTPFRSSPENVFRSNNPDKASATVVDKLLTFGSKSLTDGRWAFINCTRDFLLNEYATLLPRKETILEILENIEPDREVIAACRRLKNAGYMIALDDFCYAEKFQPFIEITDFIKVDFLSTPLALRQLLVKKFMPMGIRMLAEKVETREDFNRARQMGYEPFQGYFFCKPEILTSRQLPAYKLHYLHVLQAVSRPELDIGELERIIQRDASLCYKLLRYVNSAVFGFRREISSLRHALTLLGEREVKKWASVVAMVEIAQDRPPELLVTSSRAPGAAGSWRRRPGCGATPPSSSWWECSL